MLARMPKYRLFWVTDVQDDDDDSLLSCTQRILNQVFANGKWRQIVCSELINTTVPIQHLSDTVILQGSGHR